MLQRMGKKIAPLLAALLLSLTLPAAAVEITPDPAASQPPAASGTAAAEEPPAETQPEAGAPQEPAGESSAGMQFPVYSEGGAEEPPASSDPFENNPFPDSSGASSGSSGGESSGGGWESMPEGGESSLPEEWESMPEGWESSMPEGWESSMPEGWESSTPEGGEPSEGESSGGEQWVEDPDVPSYLPPTTGEAPGLIVSAPEDEQSATQFSPGDLDPLLSSEPEGEAGSSREPEGSSTPDVGGIFASESAGGGGGVSVLLYIGVACVVLAAAGIAFVVYRIVSARRGPRTPGKGGPRAPKPKTPGPRAPEPHTPNPRAPEPPSPPQQEAQPAQDVYHDGFHYYDDPNNDPYSDYYDDLSYGTEEARRATAQHAAQEGRDIFSGAPAQPEPRAAQRRDEAPAADFDWDAFFAENQKK